MARVNLGKVVPEKGVDYFTNEEIEEIKQQIEQEIDAQGMASAITELQLGSGHSVELTLDPQTYQLVLKLKNAAGTVLNTQTVDLPNENAVTGITYNNKKLIVAKQVGEPSEVDISPLIEGLVTESDFNTFTQTLAETIQGINETIGAINVKNLAQDESIEENYKEITKLQEELEEERENDLTSTPEKSTSYHIVDSAKAKFRRFLPEGNSEQETTEGYNLINPEDVYLFNSNKYISTKKYTTEGKIPIEANQTYSFIKKTGLIQDGKYYEYDSQNNRTQISATTITRDEYNVSVFTTSATASTFGFYQGGQTAYTDINSFLENTEMMLVKGDYSTGTLPTYEYYTGGQASPNPNYEQPIKSAGDNIQLFDKDNANILNANLSNYTKISNNSPSNRTLYLKVDPDTTYTISKIKTNNFTIGTTEEVPTLGMDYSQNQHNANASSLTITTNSKANYLLVWYWNVNDTYTEQEVLDSIKIEKGSKATPYSPYGMGSITKKIVNKNWFDKDNTTILDNANINSASVINIENNFALIYILLKAGTYCISNDIGSYQWVLSDSSQIPKIGNTVSARQITTGVNAVYTLNEEKYLLIRVAKSTVSISDFIKNLQIELGSTATDYVGHEEQTYSVYTQQPFRSSKDKTVRDCFVKKSDGWYERHYMEEVILDGSENGWTKSSNTNVDKFLYNTSLYKTSNKSFCNFFKTASSNNNKVGEWYNNVNVQLVFNYSEYGTTTLEQWKTWLSTHNLKLIQPLAEPLDLPCTEEQIQQLENKPSTYKTETNVISEDEIEAYIDAEYVIDTKTYIDNKINNEIEPLKNAIISLGGNV